ncbi:MAG: hypothetical protein U5P41_09060 [Gammaproteobacteria bacterium]|nr:hypothetical protein [Gammaproteobacteria bacterium]
MQKMQEQFCCQRSKLVNHERAESFPGVISTNGTEVLAGDSNNINLWGRITIRDSSVSLPEE